MSVSTEVQRTLVKSPPELWAELSNPDALGRHLGELGEIRITGVEPETRVEWEAEGASGVVHLKQSGWGTKVTLSLTREAPAAEAQPESESDPGPLAEPPSQPEQVAESEPQATVEPEQVAEPEPEATVEPEQVAEPEPQATVEPEPEPIVGLEPLSQSEPALILETGPALEPEPRLGFFGRLFRRRRGRPTEAVELESEPKAAPEPEPEFEALAAPEPIYPARPVEPVTDLGAELASVEAQMAEETTELLTGVLDRLGAAHHRPFSRG
jgi:hypothetical protein